MVEFPFDFEPARRRLLQQNIVAGLALTGLYPELDGKYLFCATETISKDVIDLVADEVKP